MQIKGAICAMWDCETKKKVCSSMKSRKSTGWIKRLKYCRRIFGIQLLFHILPLYQQHTHTGTCQHGSGTCQITNHNIYVHIKDIITYYTHIHALSWLVWRLWEILALLYIWYTACFWLNHVMDWRKLAVKKNSNQQN